jgi:GNAT superfamily N-acetyltransferase
MSLSIRAAQEHDVHFCHQMIVELAEYERDPEAVEATPELLREALFGARPAAEAVIAEVDGEPVGWALFYGTYSTWHGRPGLWLEDFFVRKQYRHLGVGHALFCHVAAIAVERGCSRLNWVALDWNELALGFYAKHGAETLEEWELLRLSGETLLAAARMAPGADGADGADASPSTADGTA